MYIQPDGIVRQSPLADYTQRNSVSAVIAYSPIAKLGIGLFTAIDL